MPTGRPPDMAATPANCVSPISNQVEQDLRPVKSQTEGRGGSRTYQSADVYASLHQFTGHHLQPLQAGDLMHPFPALSRLPCRRIGSYSEKSFHSIVQ